MRKWNYTDNVYYRPVGVPVKRELSAETRRKMATRPIVFLTEDELLYCLSTEEQKQYMSRIYNWLIRDCHVGPFWLSALVRAYKQNDPSELSQSLLRIYIKLKKS